MMRSGNLQCARYNAEQHDVKFGLGINKIGMALAIRLFYRDGSKSVFLSPVIVESFPN